MRQTLCVLLLLRAFVATASAQVLWKGEHELTEDRERINRGDNLIYAAAGSESYLTNTVDAVLSSFQQAATREMAKAGPTAPLQVVDLQCMDLAATPNPLKAFEAFLRDKKNKAALAAHTDDPVIQWTEIFVVYNSEALATPTDLKRLDFLFRITDKAFEAANLAAVLLWNNDQRVLPAGDSVRERFAAAWAAGAPLVNGDALAGRIARAATEYRLLPSSGGSSSGDDDGMPGAALALHCLTARTHALTASAQAIFDYKVRLVCLVFSPHGRLPTSFPHEVLCILHTLFW